MTENTPNERTSEMVHEEYLNHCCAAGDLSFRIITFQKDLDLIHQKLQELTLEAASFATQEHKSVKSDQG